MPSSSVQLRPETAEMLRRPINGDGGFQRLMRRIQAGLAGTRLTVDGADLDALIRATRGVDCGGFQRRAREILVDYIMGEIRAEAGGTRHRKTGRVLSFAQPLLPLGGDDVT